MHMKIKRTQLKRLIKEELKQILVEQEATADTSEFVPHGFYVHYTHWPTTQTRVMPDGSLGSWPNAGQPIHPGVYGTDAHRGLVYGHEDVTRHTGEELADRNIVMPGDTPPGIPNYGLRFPEARRQDAYIDAVTGMAIDPLNVIPFLGAPRAIGRFASVADDYARFRAMQANQPPWAQQNPERHVRSQQIRSQNPDFYDELDRLTGGYVEGAEAGSGRLRGLQADLEGARSAQMTGQEAMHVDPETLRDTFNALLNRSAGTTPGGWGSFGRSYSRAENPLMTHVRRNPPPPQTTSATRSGTGGAETISLEDFDPDLMPGPGETIHESLINELTEAVLAKLKR